MNVATLLRSRGEGLLGYEALREWRSVQVERPSCSTSGGQSVGSGEVVVPGAVVVALLRDLDAPVKEAKELQERQLGRCQFRGVFWARDIVYLHWRRDGIRKGRK